MDHPVIETGDAFSQLEAWRFAGLAEGNTDRGRLYVSVAESGGNAQVSVFSDRERTALVAQGTGAIDSRVTLAEQGGSGLSGSVIARLSTVSATITLFPQLCSQEDIREREDRALELLLEDPAETALTSILTAVSRAFLLEFSNRYPPPSRSSNTLRLSGTTLSVESGSLGELDQIAQSLWALNGESDWELVGLQNPGDYREWAILQSRAIAWDRRGRGEEDTVTARGASLFRQADRAFNRVQPLVDVDRDTTPEREPRASGIRMVRA